MFYNEGLPRFEFQNGLNVRMDGPRGSRILWGLADPVGARGWSSDRIDMVTRLLPHVRQLVRVRHALVETGALNTTLSQLLDNTRVGVIQLDRRGRIGAVNDRAQELLRDGDVLFDQAGALRASSLEDNTELQTLLGRALPPHGDQGESGSMVVRPRGETPPSMVLHVTPVEDRQLDFRTWRAAVLVLAVEPKKPARIDRRVLRATLGLTPGESEIAALLAEGPVRQRYRDEQRLWKARGALACQAMPRQARRIPSDGSGPDRAGGRRISTAGALKGRTMTRRSRSRGYR